MDTVFLALQTMFNKFVSLLSSLYVPGTIFTLFDVIIATFCISILLVLLYKLFDFGGSHK